MKRAANLSVDADLLDEAKEQNIDLSQTLEEALRRKVRRPRGELSAREQKWLEENREAIESWNRYVEEHGVFSDGLRRF